jgi:hypothetical protein
MSESPEPLLEGISSSGQRSTLLTHRYPFIL